MRKITFVFLIFAFTAVKGQEKVVSKNGKEIEVNKDASTTSKGIVKLAGDLGGTADAPTVPGLVTKQNTLTLTTTGSGAATLTGATLNIPTPALGSPFSLQGTATDAGTNKTSAIDRDGSIEVKNGYLKAIANNNTLILDPSDVTGPRIKVGPLATPTGFFELGAYNSMNNFDTKTRDFNLMSTAKNNAFFLKNDTGFIGIGVGNPLSLFSNAASTTNFVSSNNAIQSTSGISWLNNNAGYNTSLYNSNNVAGSNGLQVKVANTSNQTIALEVGQNTTLNGTSNPLFNVLGNGYIGVGTNAPTSRFSNTSAQIIGSNAQSSSSATGFAWSNNTSGWGSAFWSDFEGLNVKVKNTSSIAFEVGSGTTSLNDNTGASGSTPLFKVLTSGNVGIGNTTPSAKLEITSGTAGTSGLKFTNLTNTASTVASTKFLSLDATGNVIYATTGLTLPFISANGTNSSTTEVRDYNVWANRGNGFYMTDLGAAISNPIPNNNAWFTLSQVGNGFGYFGQTSLNDQGFWFRGGPTSTIASNTWLRTLSVNANSKFAAQWDNATNNTVTLNNIDNGPLAFATNNIERMRILANGNVGIGINNPNSKFEVLNSSLYNGTEAATHAFQLSSGKTNTDYTLYMGADNTNGNSYIQSVKWSVGMAPLLLNARGGNVGIGTPTPTTNLDVVGGFSLRNTTGAAGSNYGMEFNTNSNSPRIDWVNNGTYIGQFSSDANDFLLKNSKQTTGGFRFLTNPSGSSVERLAILNNGNVGIATPTPQTVLDISPSAGASSMTIGTAGTVSTEQVNINFATKYNRTTGMRTAANLGWQLGARGNTWASPQTNSFYASYWNGTTDSQVLTLTPSGLVGIGTTTPTSRFEVNGSATNTAAFNAAAATTINFLASNLAYTTASAGAFTLTNIKDGGTYTLAVQGATSGTASFTATGFTVKTVNNGPTTANKHTLYTFLVIGTNVYVYMATGF